MSASEAQPLLTQSYIDAYIGDRLKAAAIALILLETIFVALRQWSRHLQKAAVGWDDILIIPSYISCLGLCICGILAVNYGGVGRHISALEEVAPEKIPFWGRSCLIAVPVLYVPAVTLPKLVILAYFLRIFVSKPSRVACYVVATITIIVAFINIPLSIWQCSPPDFAWDPKIAGGHCAISVQAHLRYGSLPNIVTDVVMIILPLPVVWGLKMSTRNKISLTITFLVSSIGLIASIVRFVEFIATGAFDDGTWASVSLVVWSCVEAGFYLIAACLLALPKLLSTLLGGGFLSGLRIRSRGPGKYSNVSDSTQTTNALELQSVQRQKRKHGLAPEDDTMALQPQSGGVVTGAETLAERGEYPHQMVTNKDRIYVQKQFAVGSDK